MRRLAALAAFVLPLAASPISAQSALHNGFSLGIRLPFGRTSVAATACDRSGFDAIAQRQQVGRVLLYGGAITAGVGAIASWHTSTSTAPITLMVGGVGAALVGWYVTSSANSTDAMDKAVGSLRVGETRVEDVRACLGNPTSQTVRNGTEEVWTYAVSKTHVTGGGAALLLPVSHAGTEMRSVTLTFKKGVLSDVSRTASNYGGGL